MSEDDVAQRIVRAWGAAEDREGRPFQDGGLPAWRAMAEIAVRVVTGPRTWEPGETVPSAVNCVLDNRQMRWVRDVGPRGGGVWVCYASVTDLTSQVGPVTEDVPQRDRAWLESTPWDWNPAACKGCGVLPGEVHRDDCPSRGPSGDPHRRPPSRTCEATHPESGAQCDAHHHPLNTREHSNSTRGVRWVEPRVEDKTEATAVPAEPRVILTKDAVDGLVELLHQSAVKFTRLHSAYKGSATKGADTLAGECEQAAQLLQAVLNGEEEDKDA